MNNKINIIMPCYYNSKVIEPALEMISKQTAIDRVVLTMINDCSPYTDCDYSDLIDKFKDKINIRYLKTKVNEGPGNARQLGLDHTLEDYILFHDDDDILDNIYVIEKFVKIIDKNSNILSIKGGISFTNALTSNSHIVSPRQNNTMQGIVYNAQLIKNKNIRFNPLTSRIEEDNFFLSNYFIRTIDAHYQIIYLSDNDIVYHRISNNESHNSITHSTSILNKRIGLLISFIETVRNLEEVAQEYNYAWIYVDMLWSQIAFVNYVLYPILQEIVSLNESLTKKQYTLLQKETTYLLSQVDKYYIQVQQYSNKNCQVYNEHLGRFALSFVPELERNYSDCFKALEQKIIF